MDTKQPLSLFLVAILVASVFTVVGIASMPLRNASAQSVTIETSADELGGTFFGHGVLQVVIEDEDTDDDDDDTIDVTIEADGETTVSDTFTIDNTNTGSQRFEFFLVHKDSDLNNAAFLDGIASIPTIITFGDGGDLDTGDDLFEEISFEIRYGNEEVTIDYEEVPAQLSLDRDVFGSTSIVHIFIDDQDANVNPTDRDAFELDEDDLNDSLFDIDGAEFATGTYRFEETGDNTGVFELEAELGADLDANEETVQVTLNDQAVYNTTMTYSNGTAVVINGVPVNDSPETSETTFEIDDSDGELDDLTNVTFGSELVVNVRDNDQNRDSEEKDTVADAVVVEVDAVGGDSEEVDLEETGDNTGVFNFDLSNGELRITFLADSGTPVLNNGVLELRVEDIEEDLIVSYEDPLDDDSDVSVVAEFTIAINLTPGSLAAPEEVGITDEFTVALTEPDLNDNKRTRDSYSFRLDREGPWSLMRGASEFGEIYTFNIEHDGEALDFGPFGASGGSNVTITLTETDINTGIFEFEIDMDDITAFGDSGGPLAVSDGDDLEISIDDFMADATDPDEDDVTVTIGRPDVGLDFSRTTVPLPPEDGSATEAAVGDTMIVRLILVDPVLNNQTNVEQSFEFLIGDDENEFLIDVEGGDLQECTLEDGDDLGDCNLGDVTLYEVLTIGNLEETGKNTGVFEAELEFSFAGTDADPSDWQDAEFTFTYFNNEGDEESAGFTFRGNDGIVTVDQPSAKAGTELTITVEDQDLNLDDDEIDEFESGEVPGLLIIETEDDDIGGVDNDTFEETGEDTGVFTATFIVGEDIPLVDVASGDQATNILITYDDEIDSTGGSGDEIEVNVPVVSATGSIQVTPELVGPATTLTILIIDSDLDEDASSVDEYDEADMDDMVEFSSSRREVGEDIPSIEETGPNTGVFKFELELVTDAELCADDDLDGTKFDATGGDTDSSIGACPGDLIAIRYADEKAGNGGRSTVSEVIEVQSWDPEFVADKEDYNVGDRVTVTISDPDANRDPDIADTLRDIRVTSDSDRVGEEFSAIETGRDTGVFRLSFGTTSGTAGGSISVRQGDDITIRYTDEFPADFVDEEEDKDFQFVVSVGGSSGVGTTTVTPPELQDVTGQTLDEVSVGQQVVLATSVRNNNAGSQPFVALVEVRDDAGVTVFLAWQTGTLSPNGQTQVGLSWTPDVAGDYEVRTFVISDLNNPQVLSEVSTSNITVN